MVMDGYSDIDLALEAFARSHGTTLFKGTGAAPRRYFHPPGDPPFECFQIVIDPPRAGALVVWAHAIDTNDDTEDRMHQQFEGNTSNLPKLLEDAVCAINEWKARMRIAPDPYSPW